MTENNCARVSSADAEQSATKQRKKRKWDQPAESLVVAGVAVPGILPLGNMGSLAAITLPGVTSASGALLTNTLTSSSATTPPLIQPHTTAVLQKMNQKKIQDELIAREIVINDADSAVRYMLTKRQTQEEIQKCTGAVVITRGKYHPPNAPPDGEKPLYLHISAGAHLETTVERIKAVDRAAAMVEELLKQGSISNGGKATIPLSTCVYLGFEADPSLNVAARIRGPNDQYVNHIVNETGATVLLRGHGSGSSESGFGEEGQQPLHLFLSSNNTKSLESAKLLAENLLDTISIEFGASRIVLSQLWNAIPAISSATHPVYNTTLLQGTMSSGHLQPHTVSYPQLSSTAGTSYSGYGGIYPQATPLQQVALALRQSPSTVNPLVPVLTLLAMEAPVGDISFCCSKDGIGIQEREVKKPILDLYLRMKTCQHVDVVFFPHGLFSQNSFQGSEFAKPEILNTSKPESLPDTLIKLMEYGDEDDDPDEIAEEPSKSNSNGFSVTPKPFWAV
ncbi:hypothetical protein RHSIM_Rhsim10G0048800 [Rhododendron simsii]|uniref:Protein RIK n=1 Tax=Rhododendron simsii TaxID=118357 RepID=A0A834GB77_RHOSS|nr:hypothetical protein RHSIM_Rhsim10G0048800 [Rhododendron simsii]